MDLTNTFKIARLTSDVPSLVSLLASAVALADTLDDCSIVNTVMIWLPHTRLVIP